MDKRESASKQAWNDTKEWVVGNNFRTWLSVTILLAVGSVITSYMTPHNTSKLVVGLSGFGSIIIALFAVIVFSYLFHITRTLHRYRKEDKETSERAKKLEEYHSSGKPILESEAKQFSQSTDLSMLGISTNYTRSETSKGYVILPGQSNAIYTDIIDIYAIKVNLAIVGHHFNVNTARIGLEEFAISTIGFAPEDSQFKVICNSQELGMISVERNVKDTFRCHNRPPINIIGSDNEIKVMVSQTIRNKNVWKTVLNVPLNLMTGEKSAIKPNLESTFHLRDSPMFD